MAERAKRSGEFRGSQASHGRGFEELFKLVENNERRKKEQAEKGFDGLTYFVYRTMLDAGLSNPDEVSKKIKSAFVEHAGWKQSEKGAQRAAEEGDFAIFPKEDDLNKVTAMVDDLLPCSKADRS
jgi:type I restriction enzyme R subunit